MQISLAEHFNFKKLLRFVLPSVIMMIFTSIYGVVDGLFVSNFVGKTAFAALNLILPLPMAIAAIGFMIGAGGSAIVAQTLGTGDKERANRYFSMLVYLCVICGVVLTAVGFAILRPVAVAMGAEGQMLEDSLLYGRILMCSQTAYMLQNLFQNFLVTAEKPKLGLYIIIAAGLANMALDALFIVVFKWGLAGAAIATVIGQCVGGFLPIIYFARKNDSLLRLTKTKFEGRIILKTCTNGSSELMTNLSLSIVNMVYNFQLIKLAGENGVAAYGAIMYINFIFLAIFIGYSIGSAPLVGYHYGAQNRAELKNLLKKSLWIVGITGIALTALAVSLASPLTQIFVGYDPELFEMTKHGLRLFVIAFLFSGFNIFGSAFFTALGNGAVSAAISFLRTLFFQIVSVFLLPLVLGIDGIWLAIVAAELLTLVITVALLVAKNKQYRYF